MFLGNTKGRVSKKKKTEKVTYTATAMDFVLGVDFELLPDEKTDTVCVRLLKGKYAGVKYKYNSVGVKEDPKKTASENLMMTMDYKVLDYNKLPKSIEKEEDFNNSVFNVLYALMMIGAPSTETEDEEQT